MGMGSSDHQVIGLYVSPDVREVIDEFVYEHAGVVDLDDYFSVTEGSAPEGDPLGRVMTVVFEEVVDRFDELVEGADFEAVNEVDYNSFNLTRVAADGKTVYEFRDLVEELHIERGFDSRTVHTAVFREAIDKGIFEDVDLVVG